MNITNIFGKLLIAAMACAFITACGKSGSSNGSGPGSTVQPSETDVGSSQASDSADDGLQESGDSIGQANVVSVDTRAGETSANEPADTLEEIFAAYPVLQTRANFLESITRVVETDSDTLDLYAGDSLVMVLAWNSSTNMYTVRSSTIDFEADSITRTVSQDQDLQQKGVLESLEFITSACRTELVGQEPEQDQDQDQKQEKPQKPEEVEMCASIEVTMVLEREVVKQEQEQEKPQQQEQKQEKPQQQEQKQVKQPGQDGQNGQNGQNG